MAGSRGRILVVGRGVHDVRVFDPDGEFLFRFGGEGDGPEEARYTALELGDAAVIDMSGFAAGLSGAALLYLLYLYQPFGPLWLRGHGPAGVWASASRSVYEVELHAAAGSVIEIIGPSDPGPGLSTEERESARSRLERDMERGNLDEPAFEVPETKGPLADLFFDQAGRLWVEKAAADGAEMVEADVYEGATLVARYRWPSRVNPGAAPWAQTALHGTTTDELGIQRAARIRFEPNP